MLKKSIESVKPHDGNTKATNIKTLNLLKGSAILLEVSQEELFVLSRFVAPAHVLVLIFRKMVRTFFANTFYLF